MPHNTQSEHPTTRYNSISWEWRNKDNLEALLTRRAKQSKMWHKPIRRAQTRAGLRDDLIYGRVDFEERQKIAAEIDRSQQEMWETWDGELPEPDLWMTVEELAEEFGLSINTIKRHASKVSDDDKRMTTTGADRQYTWRWDRDGTFDPNFYDPPGWRAYNKFRQAENRDCDRRLPEAFRGHGQRLEGRRDVSRFGPSDRRSTSHGGMVGEQVEMLEADESLYSVDPGMAPRQDKGQQVKEYRLSAVRAVVEARNPTSGRFTKGAGHTE